MPYDDLLGRLVTLPIARFGSPGAFLDLSPEGAEARPGSPALLLPGAEVPEGAAVGDKVDVFVYLDSEDRPIATTRVPKVTLGCVAFLQVTDLTPFGAFFDVGLAKDLLVPRAEQTHDVRPGERHPIAMYVDDTSRLAGTMRVSERLRARADVALDDWVEGEAWRKDPDIGVFVIAEKCWVGLVPAHEPTTLGRGEAARFRVTSVFDDGKVELSLRAHAHEEVEGDAERILTRLQEKDAPRIGDRSTPEAIRAAYGLSKKAFKRAAGRLLKERRARLDSEGFLVAAGR